MDYFDPSVIQIGRGSSTIRSMTTANYAPPGAYSSYTLTNAANPHGMSVDDLNASNQVFFTDGTGSLQFSEAVNNSQTFNMLDLKNRA